MKIVTIIGARPQFIKAAMVSKEIAKHDKMNEIIIHTGQHFDKNMSQIFFKDMGISEPDYNLGINRLSHGAMTGRMLEELEKIYIEEKPNQVIVFGDTNSTIAGALAASKLHIPVAHVEAGLRSFNKEMPEEVNRVLVDHISNILFAPTKAAVTNLNNEGIDKNKIYRVGDIMYDAALYFTDISAAKSNIIDKLKLERTEFLLCTIHRQENTDIKERLFSIFRALEDISKNICIILPLHPRTRARMREFNISIQPNNITIINPVGYLDMLLLLKHCNLVLTDSGGLQKEAFFFNKYCLTLRSETEWVELVEHKFNYIVGGDYNEIINIFNLLSNNIILNPPKLYGNGMARVDIVKALL